MVGTAAGEVAGSGLYFSTSSRMIRPEGPEPFIFERGIPCSRAIFFARGEAKMRWPAGSSSLGVWLGVGFGGSSGAAGAFSSLGGDGLGSSLGAAAFFAISSAPDKSSPSSPITAITEPTGTPLLPSFAWGEWIFQDRRQRKREHHTMILARTPSS